MLYILCNKSLESNVTSHLVHMTKRATVKDGNGNGNGNGNWKWKLETELETGNGRQIFMLQPGVSTLHV